MPPTPQSTSLLSLPWDGLFVHYHEIILKGGNRTVFTRRLKKNLATATGSGAATINLQNDRLEVIPKSASLSELAEKISRVFGVAYTAPFRYLESDLDSMAAAAVEVVRGAGDKSATFAIRTRRLDKSFALTSDQIKNHTGAEVVKHTGARVDLDQPDIPLTFRIYQHGVCLAGPKVQGPGGLPLGVSGKVLTLFSGGIDSPVAAWAIMRRGCVSDFLHIHTFPDPERVRETKIPGLIETLLNPQGVMARLHLVPYHAFQMRLLKQPVPQELELILFRRFMMRIANTFADRDHYDAVVTGDNLAQVASQTMGNLKAVTGLCRVPVFRPLLTYDKDEIIKQARKIETYEPSIQPYKDCCSLVSRHPHTNPKEEYVLKADEAMDSEVLTEEAMNEAVTWDLGV